MSADMRRAAVIAPAVSGRAVSDALLAPAAAFVASPDVAVTMEEPHAMWCDGTDRGWCGVGLHRAAVPDRELGIAHGLSALGEKNDSQNWGTAAGIWGGPESSGGLFDGGQGWPDAVPRRICDRNGLLQWLRDGAATLLLLLWLATNSAHRRPRLLCQHGDRAGRGQRRQRPLRRDERCLPRADGAVATNVAQAVQNPETVVPAQADQAVQAAADTAAAKAGPGAWGTAIAIVLAIGAAALGGHIGQTQAANVPVVRRLATRG